jgi:D-alanyl-D-alanine carboxypeptidase (penicillin-binding protein 5/6)
MASRKKHHSNPRRVITIILAVLIVLGILDICRERIDRTLPAIQPQQLAIQTASTPLTNLTWPSTGQAAIGADDYGVMSTSGAETPVPTASVAKLITALAVLKMHPIASATQGTVITMNQNDVALYNSYAAEGGSVAAVNQGEQITEYQMLEGMLLPSANNMADSLAVWAFGSLPAYDSYANKMVMSMGLTQTHIGTDASGYLPDTTSTARDLVLLGEAVTNNSVLMSVVDQRSATLPVAGVVNNVNWLLGTDGINGLKTGNSNQDPGVYLFSAPYTIATGKQVTIVGAVMMGQTLQKAMDSAVPLLTSMQQSFHYSTALVTGQAVGQYAVPWSNSVTAVTTQPLRLLTWQNRLLTRPSSSLNTIYSDQPKGSVVGTVNSGTTTSNVVLSAPIPKPSFWWRLIH